MENKVERIESEKKHKQYSEKNKMEQTQVNQGTARRTVWVFY